MGTVSVRYVGLKDQEIDKATKMVWIGKGSVRAVDAREWPRMSVHTDVWELAEGDADHGTGLAAVAPKPAQEVEDADLLAMTIKPVPAVVVEAPSEVVSADDLHGMMTADLRVYAANHKLDVDLGLKGYALRQAIEGAMKAKA